MLLKGDNESAGPDSDLRLSSHYLVKCIQDLLVIMYTVDVFFLLCCTVDGKVRDQLLSKIAFSRLVGLRCFAKDAAGLSTDHFTGLTFSFWDEILIFRHT